MKPSLDQLSVLVVVPARAGSVGIPRKNLARIGGLSLIARVANVVKQLPWISVAIISTDDPEMRDEGRRFGLDAPFMRPAELAHGEARGSDVFYHAWIECEHHYKRRFDYAIYLQPTSPLRRPADVEHTLTSLIAGNYDTAVTVSPSPAHFAPEKCLLINENGTLRFFLEAGRTIHSRQQLPTYYFTNGAVYAARREPFLRTQIMTGDNTLGVIIDRPLVNIDDPFEPRLANWLLSEERE
jgi:CMP-N-acetylneuraminic acid synthetase